MEWKISHSPVAYDQAVSDMEARVAKIIAGEADELAWLLEHPPLYTAGTSAKTGDLLTKHFPIYETGRGGEWTYHGPGQRIAYVMLDLKKRASMDVRCYVRNLEKWIITTLAHFGVEGFTREGRIGVWVNTPIASPASGGGRGGPATKRNFGDSPYSTRQPKALANVQALRRDLTKAEKKLWYEALTCKQLENFKFRKQMPIGPYTADFVCIEKKLIVELDGGQHASDEGNAHDKKRTAFLEEVGYRVIRFWNNEVFSNLEGVAGEIGSALRETLPPLPPPLAGGTKEEKIAALGIRVRKWVTYHGIAINVSPDLSHYAGIVPCGIKGYGVTSLKKLGIKTTMQDVDKILQQEFKKIFSQ